MMIRISSKYLRLYCPYFLILGLINTTIGQTNQKIHYYYQGTQISTFNAPSQQIDFILVGENRTTALTSTNTKSISQTYQLLGDDKSQDLQLLEQSPSSINQVKNDQETQDYQAYGAAAQNTNSLEAIPFSYNDEYQDPKTNLFYLKARDYNANDQHFITMDSYLVWSRYNFANANPISNIDPTGHNSHKDNFFQSNWPQMLLAAVSLAFIVSGIRENRISQLKTIDIDLGNKTLDELDRIDNYINQAVDSGHYPSNVILDQQQQNIRYQYWSLTKSNRLRAPLKLAKLASGASLIPMIFLSKKYAHNPVGLGISIGVTSLAFLTSFAVTRMYAKYYNRLQNADSKAQHLIQRLAFNISAPDQLETPLSLVFSDDDKDF